MTSAIADWTVSLGSDGRIVSQGNMWSIRQKQRQEATQENEDVQDADGDAADEVVEPADAEMPVTANGKLVLAEEMSEGHVSLSACECITFLPVSDVFAETAT